VQGLRLLNSPGLTQSLALAHALIPRMEARRQVLGRLKQQRRDALQVLPKRIGERARA